MKQLSTYEHTLLQGWQDVHRKGQLSLWILLALRAGPKHMANIKEAIGALTHQTVSPDDKSMYRALRRFHDAEMVDYKLKSSSAGPDLKVYRLTSIGENVLEHFLDHDIRQVFYTSHVRKLIEKGKV